MLEPKKENPRHFRAGRPGYDEVGLYVAFKAWQKVSGLPATKLAGCFTVELACVASRSRKSPRITGETLRRYVVRVGHKLKSGFDQPIPATAALIDSMIARYIEAMMPEERASLERLGAEKRGVLSHDGARR